MDGGLYTFDGDTPGTPPVLVLPPSADYTLEGYIVWSPDAKWIACTAHGPNDVRAGLASILARNAAGSEPIRTMVRGEVAHFTWATNGNIYFWDSLHRRSVLSPPTEWQPVTLPLPDRPFLLPTRPGTRVVYDFRCQPQEYERQVSLQAADVYAAFPIGTLPDMQRYLFTIQDNIRGFYTAVVDFNGTILVDLGDQVGPNGFIATSLFS